MDASERLRWDTVGDDPQRRLFGSDVERVTHPEFAGMEFLHVRAKSIINEVPGAAHLPFRYTVNVYRGCSHACAFCFARPTLEYLNLNAGRDFERVIVVKVNAVELLTAELQPRRWAGEHIAMGTNTDPYQRCEGRYELTRGVIEVLTEHANPFSILTKSSLVTRDMDLLIEANRRTDIAVNFSIPTLDRQVWEASEPGTPQPRSRLDALRRLREEGIPAGVLIAPIIPGISDRRDQLEEVVRACIDAGASSITPIVLHLRPGVKEQFLPWLEDVRPDLLDRYRRTYQRAYAPKQVRQHLSSLVYELIREHGGPLPDRNRSPRNIRSRAPERAAAAESQQLSLGV